MKITIELCNRSTRCRIKRQTSPKSFLSLCLQSAIPKERFTNCDREELERESQEKPDGLPKVPMIRGNQWMFHPASAFHTSKNRDIPLAWTLSVHRKSLETVACVSRREHSTEDAGRRNRPPITGERNNRL